MYCNSQRALNPKRLKPKNPKESQRDLDLPLLSSLSCSHLYWFRIQGLGFKAQRLGLGPRVGGLGSRVGLSLSRGRMQAAQSTRLPECCWVPGTQAIDHLVAALGYKGSQAGCGFRI